MIFERESTIDMRCITIKPSSRRWPSIEWISPSSIGSPGRMMLTPRPHHPDCPSSTLEIFFEQRSIVIDTDDGRSAVQASRAPIGFAVSTSGKRDLLGPRAPQSLRL